jgi:hypothetical protein
LLLLVSATLLLCGRFFGGNFLIFFLILALGRGFLAQFDVTHAVLRDDVDFVFPSAIGDEGNPTAVGRPGKRAVMAARGDIFTVPAKDGVTRKSGVMSRSVMFTYAGPAFHGQVAFTGESDGEFGGLAPAP